MKELMAWDAFVNLALQLAREAVAEFEEAYGHNPSIPRDIRAGKHDGWERVVCAKHAVLLSRGLKPTYERRKTRHGA